MRKERAFTLLELVIVLIVIGIIMAAGIVNYTSVLNNTRKREAVNLIDSIYVAEKNYMFEAYGAVNACVNISDCNTKLRLAIPLTTSCAYSASDSGGGAFCVQADCSPAFQLRKRSSSNSFSQGLCP